MGWEKRGNRHYYYQARRAGGRVVKEYVPPLVAEAVALIDDDRRQLRKADADAARAERDALAARDAPVLELVARTDLLVRAALLAAGYRQHHRGEWRKTRARTEPTD